MNRVNMRLLLIVILSILLSCSNDDGRNCDDFEDVTFYQQRTDNGVPYGYMNITVQGSPLRSYDASLPLMLARFNQWKSMYREACGNDLYTDDEVKYYYENARYYANQLIAQYRTAKNVILEFDGVSDFTVTLKPVDPDSAAPDFIFLQISDLVPGDIGVEITLDSTKTNRKLIIDFESDIYNSLESGSTVKIKISSIRPSGELTYTEIISPSVIFNDSGNMESVSISGSINAWRE